MEELEDLDRLRTLYSNLSLSVGYTSPSNILSFLSSYMNIVRERERREGVRKECGDGVKEVEKKVEEEAAVKEAVQALDADNDGCISFIEFKRGFPKIETLLSLKIDPTLTTATNTHAQDEVVNFITSEQLMEIQRYFHTIDQKKKGSITHSDIVTGLMCMELNEAIFKLIETSISFLCVDAEGHISFAEFLKAIRKGAELLYSKKDNLQIPTGRPRSLSIPKKPEPGSLSPRPSRMPRPKSIGEADLLRMEVESLKDKLKEKDIILQNMRKHLDIKVEQLEQEKMHHGEIMDMFGVYRKEREEQIALLSSELQDSREIIINQQQEIITGREKLDSTVKAYADMNALLTEENREVLSLAEDSVRKERESGLRYEGVARKLKRVQEVNVALERSVLEKSEGLKKAEKELHEMRQNSQAQEDLNVQLQGEITLLQLSSATSHQLLEDVVNKLDTEHKHELSTIQHYIQQIELKLEESKKKYEEKRMKMKKLKLRVSEGVEVHERGSSDVMVPFVIPAATRTQVVYADMVNVRSEIVSVGASYVPEDEESVPSVCAESVLSDEQDTHMRLSDSEFAGYMDQLLTDTMLDGANKLPASLTNAIHSEVEKREGKEVTVLDVIKRWFSYEFDSVSHEALPSVYSS